MISVSLGKYLKYFFTSIWHILEPLDIFKSHKSNYTLENVWRVYNQKPEMYNYLNNSLENQI